MALDAAAVRDLAASAGSLAELTARQSVCRACPRLVAWREEVAAVKRRSFAEEPYWGRPIAGWGDSEPGVLIVGLAPAAHGGNRTGRIFTGDRSGDFLFASLFRCGLAAQPTSVTAGDGQRLIGARMAAAVRCAPPANKPTTEERDTCAPWLAAELGLVQARLRVIVCLGLFAWQAAWARSARPASRCPVPGPRSATAPRSGCRWPLRRTVAVGCSCWVATTRASRTPLPGGLPERCWMRSSSGPVRWPGCNPIPPWGDSATRPSHQPLPG